MPIPPFFRKEHKELGLGSGLERVAVLSFVFLVNFAT